MTLSDSRYQCTLSRWRQSTPVAGRQQYYILHNIINNIHAGIDVSRTGVALCARARVRGHARVRAPRINTFALCWRGRPPVFGVAGRVMSRCHVARRSPVGRVSVAGGLSAFSCQPLYAPRVTALLLRAVLLVACCLLSGARLGWSCWWQVDTRPGLVSPGSWSGRRQEHTRARALAYARARVFPHAART